MLGLFWFGDCFTTQTRLERRSWALMTKEQAIEFAMQLREYFQIQEPKPEPEETSAAVHVTPGKEGSTE